jgi:hypothetical protein
MPSLPLPPFYDKAMPPKNQTRPALKTDGVKTRVVERKELTRRQVDLHASSLISQAEAILSFCAQTDEGGVVSPGGFRVNDALIFCLFVISNVITYLIL